MNNNTLTDIAVIRQENEKVLQWIKDWQSKHPYNPKYLEGHNALFNQEFNDHLQQYSQETIKFFQS